MTPPDGPATIRFHGPPGALRALAAADDAPTGSAELALGAAPGVPVSVAPAGPGAVWLTASLPADTAPGPYPATLTPAGGAGATAAEIAVEVHPEPRVVVSPPSLVVRGAPGEHVPVVLTVANVGNVATPLPRFGAFGVMARRGVEDAIGAALRSSRDGIDRVAVLADALARRHGGLVVVSDIAGHGDLAPGEVRDLAGTLRIPGDQEPGRSYAGTWLLAGTTYRVEIHVGRTSTRASTGRAPT
ncbi:hypothetical protein [Actinomycetospora aeridis]|uniref:Uncharacterized protein n=1 Tax=Actinomycetospora aeridis TaxID=3129231 RepID=A0ABU8N9X4_9PSEU